MAMTQFIPNDYDKRVSQLRFYRGITRLQYSFYIFIGSAHVVQQITGRSIS